MFARRITASLVSLLLAGLCAGLAACAGPGAAGVPDPSLSPGADTSPEPTPTPSTGNVQPIITF